jgi:hypothetical protein
MVGLLYLTSRQEHSVLVSRDVKKAVLPRQACQSKGIFLEPDEYFWMFTLTPQGLTLAFAVPAVSDRGKSHTGRRWFWGV